MVTDPIADMLTNIRNANQMRYETVEVCGTKMTLGIAEILKKEGHPITFPGFLKISAPFTVLTTAAAAALLWLVWA